MSTETTVIGRVARSVHNGLVPPQIAGTASTLRATPSQQRSAARLDELLDAAARIVDEIGYAGITTALVAERAGSAIGTVYRYFPDRIALLTALRDREVARFHSMVLDNVRNTPHSQVADGADCVIDAYVHMHKHEPGFRIIRFEGPDGPSEDSPHDYERPGYFARMFAGIMAEEFSVAAGEQGVFQVEVVAEICDALVTRAFKTTPDGEQKFIDEARVLAREYLYRHFDQR